MKTSVSYVLSLLQRLGIKHNTVMLKRSNTLKENSCNTLRVNRKTSGRPEPGYRQSTLNPDEKNHSAIKKVIKTADRLSMAGFVNNVLGHHFREHEQEITGITRSYMSDLYKEDE